MDTINIMGFHQLPSTIIFDDPQPKRHPQDSPHIHQMRKRCKNNYIEALGAVYWAKNAAVKKS